MVGWEHEGDKQTDTGSLFNMILRDGTRSNNYVFERYDYFLPQNKRITAVTIYYGHIIRGFRFHLSDGSNWDIGHVVVYDEETETETETVTVDIAENEVIVGF